jgi:hypothetical protein
MSIVPEPITLRPQFAIPSDWRLADLQQRLGNIPAERIRLNPPPGYATEEDVLRIEDQEDILCELVSALQASSVHSPAIPGAPLVARRPAVIIPALQA